MKYLIVNGDDFGASPGINRGIIEAHQFGILTSTSLMVDAPFAEDAVCLSRSFPMLSVGLHIDFSPAEKERIRDSHLRLRSELRGQLWRFYSLTGKRPSHLDSHHDVHRDPPLEAEY